MDLIDSNCNHIAGAHMCQTSFVSPLLSKKPDSNYMGFGLLLTLCANMV
jgi:hypothetical protein